MHKLDVTQCCDGLISLFHEVIGVIDHLNKANDKIDKHIEK